MRNKFMVSYVVASMAALTVTAASWAAPGGAAPSGGSMDMPMPQRTPQEIAKQAYNTGIKHLKDATEHEEDAAKATEPKKIAKAREKTAKSYQKALKEFTTATTKVPSMYEAWNYVGFTQRHLGDYKSSLAAYAKALELKPNYPEAIEYRGEAYLGLNQIEDAKAAYMTLFGNSRPLADQLMAAMQQWVSERRANAAGVVSDDIEKFAQWIAERATIAQQTASLAVDAPRTTWN